MVDPTGATPPACCTEYGGLSRRGLLRGALGVGATTAMFGTTFLQASPATAASAAQVVVLLSLRGGSDGLSLVVPHGDPAYYSARPRIAIPKASLLAKDGFFGLHPSLAPLLPLWNAGRIATVHATGLPAPNRSHFSAMEELEEADPGSTARIGWLNRLIGTDTLVDPLQAVGLGMSIPITALYGPEPVVTAGNVDAIDLAGTGGSRTRRFRSMHTLWDHAGGPLGRGGRAALDLVGDIAPVQAVSKKPANGAVYPQDDLGSALAAAARVIRGDVGTSVIAIDHDGGWDMHTDLGTLSWGQMLRTADSFARALAAFFVDLGSLGNKVTVVAVSEFGRRVRENANAGLDHGHGNAMFLLGAGVKGGYYGNWPGLVDSLDADLQVTTDYRSVLSEVVTRRLGASTSAVFPGFTPEAVGAVLAAG